jgi:hypothetical protein
MVDGLREDDFSSGFRFVPAPPVYSMKVLAPSLSGLSKEVTALWSADTAAPAATFRFPAAIIEDNAAGVLNAAT